MKFLIFGDKGQLGSCFKEIFEKNRTRFYGVDIDHCDISDIEQVRIYVKSEKPTVILNCAAYNLVDDAEINNAPAYSANKIGTKNIALVAKEFGAFFVHYSTDYVFDGTKGKLYVESDKENPVNEYGRSKLEGEIAIKEVLDDYLIFRLSWVYGNGKQNFIHKFTEWASNSAELNISNDEYSIPTSVDLVAQSTLKALELRLSGLFHLTASGSASRFDWAKEIANLYKLEVSINPVSINTFNLPAKRPLNSSMSNELLSTYIGKFPNWKEDLARFINKK